MNDQQKADKFTNQLINKNRLRTFQHHRVDAKQLEDALHVAATLLELLIQLIQYLKECLFYFIRTLYLLSCLSYVYI